MKFGALLLINKRVGHLLHPVVGEPVTAVQAAYDTHANRLPEYHMQSVFGLAPNCFERGDSGAVSKASQLLERLSRDSRKPAQLLRHQIYDIVCEPLCPNALQVPEPPPGVSIEGEEAVFG